MEETTEDIHTQATQTGYVHKYDNAEKKLATGTETGT